MSSGNPIITASALLEAYAHARETYPEECCGFLLGPPLDPDRDWLADESQRCVNRQNELRAKDPATFSRDAKTAYNIGAEDLKQLDRSLRRGATRRVHAIYHSHCDVGSYFSEEDQSAAKWEDAPLYPVHYVVIDAQRDEIRGARLFSWSENEKSFVCVAEFDRDGTKVASQ